LVLLNSYLFHIDFEITSTTSITISSEISFSPFLSDSENYHKSSNLSMSRDKHEIICQILQSIQKEPASRTKIMYLALLNYNQVNHYLSRLKAWDLISLQPETKKYSITERGDEMLKLYYECVKLQLPGPTPIPAVILNDTS
jgi:predicted transcriptional regulator